MIEIKTTSGKIVARMHVKDNLLHGKCIWYDAKGEPIVEGEFKHGKPYQGTFINWNKFFISDKSPYDKDHYCKDYITMFEMSHDSGLPDYDKLIESYTNGVLDSSN